MFAALATGAFTLAANVETHAAESVTPPAIEPVEATAAGPATALHPAYGHPRRHYSWQPRTFPRWSYRPRNFEPRWRNWSQPPYWRYRWGNGAPYRSTPRHWQQPKPSWRAWRSYEGYRGYAAAPWRRRD
jgi:hypothetical protein